MIDAKAYERSSRMPGRKGFDYYEARDMTSLRALLPHFLDVRTTAAPAILNIVTDGDSGAEAWRAYIRSISHNE